MNPEIFREYDIRGVVEKDLSATIYRQLGHLFKGLGRMVALMLSESNVGHRHVDHLKQMELLIEKGDTLLSQHQVHGTSKEDPSTFSPPAAASSGPEISNSEEE